MKDNCVKHLDAKRGGCLPSQEKKRTALHPVSQEENLKRPRKEDLLEPRLCGFELTHLLPSVGILS